MKIALYSSKRDRCGISTYTSNLENALRILGHQIEYFSSWPPYDPVFQKIKEWSPDVFHVQHETSIIPHPDEMARRVAELGVPRCFTTLHTVNQATVDAARRIGRIIIHNPTPLAPEALVLRMPCTLFTEVPSKEATRRKYGFPEKAFLISTIGFLIPWKEHPAIAAELLPWILGRPNVHLQIIASSHFNQDMAGYAAMAGKTLEGLRGSSGHRIHHVAHYPSDYELVERLSMSDLGYAWCPFDTESSSAASAQFISARCPLVATDSTHYSHMGDAAVYASKSSVKGFVEKIRQTADDSGLLAGLRMRMDRLYQERNYLETARRHVAAYKGEI